MASVSQTTWYVLFPNHTQGLRLAELLKETGIKATIVPTPRKLSVSCGISLQLADQQDIPTIRRIIEEQRVEILEISALTRDIDPTRDRYC